MLNGENFSATAGQCGSGKVLQQIKLMITEAKFCQVN